MLRGLFFVVLIVIICASCAPNTRMRMHGNVKSDDNVEIVYEKSEEQRRYEKAKKRTGELTDAVMEIDIIRIPVSLLMMPVGAVHKGYEKFKKGMKRSNHEKN